MALALLLWVAVAGKEYGLSYGLFYPALIVWLFIAHASTALPFKPELERAAEGMRWNFTRFTSHGAHALVVFVLFFIASALVTVVLSFSLPVAPATRIATAIILLPLLWSLLAYCYLATRRKLWTFLVSLTLTGVCLISLLLR